MTTNTYRHPVDSYARMTYTDSPAHVGPLVHSVDFIVPIGTAVRAAHAGRVVDMKNDGYRGGDTRDFEQDGNFVEIEHEHGEFSEYEHLRKGSIIVKIGDIVRKGQIIGHSGATGWLGGLGPHLHFMVGVYPNNDLEAYRTIGIKWDGERK
jgi:murein DD-endopeptidase MepM/ murein hydrolase activator NlpD